MASSSPTLQQVQDDIDLYQALLQSVDGMANKEEEQQEYTNRLEEFTNKLTELRAKVDDMGTTWSGMNGRSTVQHNELSNFQGTQSPSASNLSFNNDHASAPRQFLNLPSRKRDRNDFDDDMDTTSLHKTKSRRSTPAESPALSSVDSVGTDYFDDPGFSNLLGDNWREDVRSNKDYLKKQEAQKRQQEEDEKLARRLQEEWAGASEPASKPTISRPIYPSFQATQSTFRPDGAFGLPNLPIKEEQRRIKPENKPESVDSPATINSSDDDLTFIGSNPRQYGASGPSRILPPSFGQGQTMPGAYSMPASYLSQPGTSVYGGSSSAQPGNAFNMQLPSLSSLNPLPDLSRLGSLVNPFDLSILDAWNDVPVPLPRSYETVDPRETQEEIRQLLQHIRPDEDIELEASEHQPEALRVKLMPHQVKGVAWMKKMEDGSNKGGILADDMGLGKTVQAIALMLSRTPPEGARHPTLIVTPVALMEQWKREISKFVKSRATMTIHILHGQQAHRSWSRVKHFDVILTSYGTLASELKRKLRWEEKLKLNPDSIKSKADECTVLDDKSYFHRVFLDEAQGIKNRNTKAAAAACRIQSTFRWCLSGTPMQNNVEDVYSLIKFCRIRPYNDIEKFNRDIGRPLRARHELSQKRAMEKLQALLKAILLRRTKKSEIDGQPILQLPEKHTVETRAIFSKDQLDFYQALETQSKIQFNKFVKNGSVGQNYSQALVLLLRLRQCCCSPQLITNSADFMTESGIEGIDLVANAKQLPKEVVNRIKDSEDMECPICMDAVENPTIFNPCGHGLCQDCFSKMVDNVHQENADNIKCPHCRATIDTKKITDYISFQEVFGDSVLSSVIDEDDDKVTDSDSDHDSIESDGSDDGDDLKDFIVNDDERLEIDGDTDVDDDDDDDLDRIGKPRKELKPFDKAHEEGSTDVKDTKMAKQKRRDKKTSGGKKEHKSLADLRKAGMKSREAKKKYLRQLGKIYEPCAKVDKTLELLEEIEARGEHDKTIVFSSFTSFLDLIEVPLSQDKQLSNYTRYDGSMSAKDRNAAVLHFTDDPNCRVMLISLKAGNAGLNLTVANHVIILDPFWNPFVEYQAADRCYRIGQRKEVTVHRVLIGEEGVDHEANPEHMFTVEDRILALQEKKRRLVENALDENGASGVGRLGVRELGYLFGVNDMPANGR